MTDPHAAMSAIEGFGHARDALRLLSIALVVCGLGALLAMNALDWHAQWVAERQITQMREAYDDASDPMRLACKSQAEQFNARLAGGGDADPLWPYERQLLFKEEPMMSYIEIPQISVRLPIYHGVEENALMAGVGHWPSSSLPIGGPSAHCVLLAHSGMSNARMFDDIRLLRNGDRFVLWSLGEPHAYEVFDTRVVLPQEVPALIAIEPGRDLVTLVTCTPYGVNSHRLLVRAERCAYEGPDGDGGPAAPRPGGRTLSLVAAAALVAIATAACAITRHRRRIDRASERSVP